ncbi:hypothetical protein H0H87_002493 [Tephrocybe sp. NHM501043]|nr:hypothetical protein H0H87_002493 [Tephrocybe sp. NHM501043]
MLDKPIDIPSNESPYIKPTKFNQNQANNYGSQPDNRILLDIPSETLTGITAYLDPPSLFSLARVHSRLAAHVKNDNTWHRAFVCQFLGISPESEIRDDVKSLMLRRSEGTWRNEFIARYKLRRRWERSRNPTVAHIPVHSEISSMHIMPNAGLLASSIRYGVVSRSLPLNGKILPGYLDASGVRIGLGIGNPNAEFTPDVSVCAISSDGGTAKILWGFQHGEIGILTAPRTMDTAKRPVSEMVRCGVDEEHGQVVMDAVWDDASAVAVSGAADGTVKLWNAKTVRCLWTSEPKTSLEPHPCLKVSVSAARGIVAAVIGSGDIVVWTDLQIDENFSSAAAKKYHISCPVISTDLSTEQFAHVPTILRIDTHASTPTLLVAFEDDPFFYRISIDQADNVDITPFGDAAFGPHSSIAPFFSSTDSGFILIGDRIGCVSVYPWTATSSPTPVRCARKFEAYEDGAHVTALAWNGVTLITGSDRGLTHVWDALTFEHLRSFLSPVPRIRGRGNHNGREREPVRQILVDQEKQVLLVNVGDRVLAWVAGPVPRNGPGGVRGRHTSGAVGKKKKDRIGAAKYFEQVELHETISESKTQLMQEFEYMQKAHGRAREQYARLETMGLDEAEAVEYVLMLSRDEALHRASTEVEEGVFENFDFDDLPPHAIASSSTTNHHFGAATPKHTRWMSASSSSNKKVRVSPPFRAEPMEAGWGDKSPSLSPPKSRSPQSPDKTHFPPMSGSTSPPAPTNRAWGADRSTVSRSSSIASLSSAYGDAATPGSPRSRRSSGWAVPLRSPTATRSPVSVASSVSSNRSLGMPVQEDEEMDEELKFVLELSLAEARSRGEVL